MRRAFTLVELLVVIAIIGLLSTVAVVALSSSRKNSRNIKRKADMVQISKALELYYADNGSYPIAASWHGVCSAYGSYPDAYVDSTHDAWIPGLTPSYMKSLPRDPNTNKVNPDAGHVTCRTDATYSCYTYISDGKDYSIYAHCTPEGTMSASDPFYDGVRPTWAWRLYTPGARIW